MIEERQWHSWLVYVIMSLVVSKVDGLFMFVIHGAQMRKSAIQIATWSVRRRVSL